MFYEPRELKAVQGPRWGVNQIGLERQAEASIMTGLESHIRETDLS